MFCNSVVEILSSEEYYKRLEIETAERLLAEEDSPKARLRTKLEFDSYYKVVIKSLCKDTYTKQGWFNLIKQQPDLENYERQYENVDQFGYVWGMPTRDDPTNPCLPSGGMRVVKHIPSLAKLEEKTGNV